MLDSLALTLPFMPVTIALFALLLTRLVLGDQTLFMGEASVVAGMPWLILIAH